MNGLPTDAVVGVAGAGRMGAGIAAVAASAGHAVLLYDALEGMGQRGREGIAADWRTLVGKGKITQAEADARLARISVAGVPEDLARAGLVIEAIFENIDAKIELFRRIEAAAPPDIILATNTSSLSVAAMAGALKRPARFAGFHFFVPAPVMPLVEVIGAPSTDAAVLDLLYETARAWGKTPVRCASTPGFIVNRIARPFYAEAMRLLAEGAGDAATLDAVMRECGLFRMGAFELTDMIGHDVNLAVTKSVYDAFFQDPRYRPSLVQQGLVDAGLLGRKSGCGFFDYTADAVRPAPAAMAAGPRPARIIVQGDLGTAAGLAVLAEAAGITVESTAGDGMIALDGVRLALTDGRTATERSVAAGGPMVCFDFSPDYAAASRIAIAAPDGADPRVALAAAGFFQAIGKTVSQLDDAPGLIVMRTVAMLANEAFDAVHQSVASAEDIEVAMIKGAGYPQGPLALGRIAGPAALLTVLENLARAYPEGRYRPSPLLRRAACQTVRTTAGRIAAVEEPRRLQS